jgi:hypothetical protein
MRQGLRDFAEEKMSCGSIGYGPSGTLTIQSNEYEWRCKMAGVTEDFELKGEVWRATWQTRKGRTLKLFVIGDADLMRSQAAPIRLQTLKDSIDEIIDKASQFANASECAEDISLADGIVPSSIVIRTWDNMVVWFDLGASDRMLGVRMHDDEPVGVYCDHP